jgi:hypothetical protein
LHERAHEAELTIPERAADTCGVRRFRLLVGVPLAVLVAVLVVGNLTSWSSGSATIWLGVFASGLIAGALEDARTGVAAAAMYFVILAVFLIVGLAFTDPAHFS